MPAATTEAQVCNLALALVGSRQFIDRLDENSTEADVCNRLFRSTRNRLLEAWPWRFAQKRTVLALSTETRSGWGYCYTMPANCLKPRRIWDGERRPGAGGSIPFAKELNDAGTGHLICTDQEQAELVYTMELTAVGLWPAHFVEALAAALAVPLGAALSAKPQLMQMLKQNAVLELRAAAKHDADDAEADPEPDSEWIRERG